MGTDMNIKSYNKNSFEEEIDKAKKEIKYGIFIPFFKSLMNHYKLGDIKSREPRIFMKKINTINDLSKFPNSSPGLYVILTDYMNGYEENKCTLKVNELDKVKAIYRGESSNVQLRLKSHLFHRTYVEERKKEISNGKKRHDDYMVCMKLKDSEKNGINLEDEEYCSANWYVIYHGMRETQSFTREIAEKAFDEVFGKPICSRDK